MNERNYWEEFCHTGKIADYLSYCSAAGTAEDKSTGQKDRTGGQDKDEGVWSNAGAGSRHRDDIKG